MADPTQTSPELPILPPDTGGAHRADVQPLTDEEIHASNLELTSRMETLTDALRKKVEQDEFNTTTSRIFRGFFGIAGIWIVEISIAVYLLFNAIHANDTAKQADARSICQSKVNAQLIAGLRERGIAAANQNTALDNFMTTLLDPKSSTPAKTKAFVLLHNAIHSAAISKDANPLPTETCR